MEGSRHESLAGDVSEDVEAIITTAERDAAEIRREADADSRQRLDAARDEMERAHVAAGRELEGVAAGRIAKLLELRRSIDARARELARRSDAGDAVLGQLNALSDAIAERADRIAQEAAITTPAVDRSMGEEAQEPDEPPPPPRPRRFAREQSARERWAPAPATIRWARLTALRMAIGGSPREDVEQCLLERYELADARALLDDVFGAARVAAGE